MRKKSILGALVGVLTLAVAAVALAVPSSESTFEIGLTAKPKKAGTPKKPKPVVYKLTMDGGTVSGTGQPATSEALNITQPKQWKYNGKIWPKKQRCDIEEVNLRQTDDACPKGSKIGFGFADALGGDGTITEHIEVTAYVIKNGNIGFWLFAAAPPAPVAVNAMIEGKAKGRKINVAIPPAIQEPVLGVPTGIDVLEFTLNGKTKIKQKVKVRGKRVTRKVTRGVVESTACKGGKWTLKVENVYRAADGGGSKSDTADVPCRKP